MRFRTTRIATILALLGLFLTPCLGHAAPAILNGRFGSFGGPLKVASTTHISVCQMSSFGPLTRADLDVMYQAALAKKVIGAEFLDLLNFRDCVSGTNGPGCNDTRLETLLLESAQNHETVGFTTEFQNTIEQNLKDAVVAFAYLAKTGYPADAQDRLNETLGILLSAYMVFGNEFLIDALDFRFSATNPNMDSYLTEQIGQLAKAAQWYRQAAAVFASLWGEPVGYSSQVLGQYFNQDTWELYHLLCQRMAMTARESAAKQQALRQRPAKDVMAELSADVAGLYVQTAAMAQTTGSNFSVYGGQGILAALNGLERLLMNYKSERNMLGYDERYVPLAPFESIYGIARGLLASCQTLENEIQQQDKREYDYVLDKITEQESNLELSYKTTLGELTGCNVSLPIEEFLECAKDAGFDLYDCSMELDPTSFNACILQKASANSVLAAKYRQIKDADIGLERAKLVFDNITKQIENENASVQYRIELLKAFNSTKKTLLDNYLKDMKNAVTITETSKKEKTKGGSSSKSKTKSTEKSFYIKNEPLELDIKKEKDLLDATQNYEIQLANDNQLIKNLLLQQADALIGIDLAVQNKNAMIAAYDATLRNRDTYLDIWTQNQSLIDNYWQKKLPAYRILKSQKVIDLSEKFYELSHYCFLAAKALEYKYMNKIEGISLAGGAWLNLADVHKCQLSADFDVFLIRLNTYATLVCEEPGSFAPYDYTVSLAWDILGLTNMSLGDSNYDGYVDGTSTRVEDVRFQKFQQFVNSHLDSSGNLVFQFSTSILDPVFTSWEQANIKIWQGPLPCNTSTSSKGLSASLRFTGSHGALYPKLTITQKGVQSFFRKNREKADYYPVNTLALLNTSDTAPEPVTSAFFRPFYDESPLENPNSTRGAWTSYFTNRGVAATEWTVTVNRLPNASGNYVPVPFNQLRDLELYFSTSGSNLDNP
jgi:hypothetical protein